MSHGHSGQPELGTVQHIELSGMYPGDIGMTDMISSRLIYYRQLKDKHIKFSFWQNIDQSEAPFIWSQ